LRTKKIAYHIAFWLLAYIFWIFVFRSSTLVLSHDITIQFCYLIFIAANYYFNILYGVPYLLNKKKYVQFFICFILAILVTAILRVPVSVLVYTYVFKITNFHFDYLSVFFNSFINILFWVVIILGGKLIAEKIRVQKYIEQIEKERSVNELNFLRAQFNPHFLFNSINSIYGHIDKSNKEARNMLLVFSEMLRYQLYECNVEQIELDRELNYIRNYVAIQKSRIDCRIKVLFSADKVNGHIKVAPLLLITFIENAFKYVGFNENRDNLIDINLSYESGDLKFSIFNTKDNFINITDINMAERSSGLGIANTKRRLELLYPNKHTLQINDQENYYEITLILHDI
jgi:two-component system LytT family sensor kinase